MNNEVVYDCGTVTTAELMAAALKRRRIHARQRESFVHVFPTQGLQRAAMSGLASKYEAHRVSGA